MTHEQVTNTSDLAEDFPWDKVHNDLSDIWNWSYITIAAVWLIAGIPGNFMVIIACCIFEKMRNIPSMLIANLALSDLIVCASNVISTWVTFFHDRAFFLRHPKLCTMNGFICGIGCFCSMACICTIALNRYIAICHHSVYKKTYNLFTLPFHIIVTWFVGAVVMAPAILGIGGHGFEYDSRQVLCTRSYLTQKGHNLLQYWEAAIPLPISSLIMIFTYSKIFSKARESSKNMLKWNKGGRRPNINTPSYTPRDLKLMKTLVIMFIIFIVANGPWFLVMLIDFDGFHHSLYYISAWLFHSASAVNPLIYAARYPEFQECFRRMFNVMTLGACFGSSGDSTITTSARAADISMSNKSQNRPK